MDLPGPREAAGSPAADRSLARAIEDSARIELSGGTWLEWYHAANDHRRERSWTRALRRAHAAGATVHASGGAAAWVASFAPVPRAVLDKPAQVPHDRSLDLPVGGLGLCEGPLVGVLEAASPSADRVVERAVTFGFRSVLLLTGPVEVELDPAARTAEIRAAPGGFACWIDLGAGTRSRGAIRGARVALPQDGDLLELRTGRLRGAVPLAAGDVLGPPTQRLLALLSAPQGEPAPPPWLRAPRASGDERSARSPLGGLSGVRLDFELAAP
ncbi:MAG: hypothetical protein JNK02_09710 [Planctomycetes bacterium]|nr:hypothetical protein [Planctomycetota bacterium]